MDMIEELAMMHLCRDRSEFLSPQFDIGGGWSCPDFVSLNPAKRVVRVVEVSTAWDVGKLIANVNDCENQWFSKLQKFLTESSVVGSGWEYRITIYIRRNSTYRPDKVSTRASVALDVVFLEDIGFPWQEAWFRGPSAEESRTE